MISILPNQQATSWIVDSLLGQVLPGSTHEFVENSNAAMIGMAMPIEAPGLSRLSALLKPGGQKVGEELANSNVRALVGTAEEASATFKQLIGSAVPEVMKDGKVLVAKIEGLGTITLREVSSTTPAPAATIEIRVQGLGIREVKFFRTTDDLIKAKTGGEK